MWFVLVCLIDLHRAMIYEFVRKGKIAFARKIVLPKIVNERTKVEKENYFLKDSFFFNQDHASRFRTLPIYNHVVVIMTFTW